MTTVTMAVANLRPEAQNNFRVASVSSIIWLRILTIVLGEMQYCGRERKVLFLTPDRNLLAAKYFNKINYHMSIKKSQAILKCFYLKIPSLAIGLRWAQKTKPCFVTLRTIFSVRLPVKVFKTLSDRQSYILRKFHISKKYPAKPSYHMLMKKRQAKFTAQHFH